VAIIQILVYGRHLESLFAIMLTEVQTGDRVVLQPADGLAPPRSWSAPSGRVLSSDTQGRRHVAHAARRRPGSFDRYVFLFELSRWYSSAMIGAIVLATREKERSLTPCTGGCSWRSCCSASARSACSRAATSSSW
jgi:hypothetical protein